MITTFRGRNGLYGLEDSGGVLYEATFTKPVADAVAEMENSDDVPRDWYETKERLIAMGLLPKEE